MDIGMRPQPADASAGKKESAVHTEDRTHHVPKGQAAVVLCQMKRREAQSGFSVGSAWFDRHSCSSRRDLVLLPGTWHLVTADSRLPLRATLERIQQRSAGRQAALPANRNAVIAPHPASAER
jgi:hypothetical protein